MSVVIPEYLGKNFFGPKVCKAYRKLNIILEDIIDFHYILNDWYSDRQPKIIVNNTW